MDIAPGTAKRLKVAELRDALGARGLDTSGLKADLVRQWLLPPSYQSNPLITPHFPVVVFIFTGSAP